jgi:hypothetical protein
MKALLQPEVPESKSRAKRKRKTAYAKVVDIMLTVPRSFLFFCGRACSQPYEEANLSRGANTRL